MDDQARQTILDKMAAVQKARITTLDDQAQHVMLDKRAAAKRQKLSNMMCEINKHEDLKK